MDIFAIRNFPRKVAEAPKSIKIKEKPRMKKSEFKLVFFKASTLSSFFCSSSKVSPEMKDRYPGIKGRTQGEMKEIKPPVKAAKIETSFRNPPKNSGPVIKNTEREQEKFKIK